MENAFAWLGNIAEWIGQWIPKWDLIEPTHQGVLVISYWRHEGPAHWWWRGWVADVRIKVLQPGTHFYWPIRSKLHNYPVARQARDLREQTFATTDDMPLTIGAAGVISFEIADVIKATMSSWNTDETVVDVAMTAVHSVCCRRTWKELKALESSGELDKQLKAEAQKALNPIGVKVLKLNLTDLAPTLNVKLSNSNFQVV